MNSSNKLMRTFWTWTSQARPHWRKSPVEAAVLFCVFGVTGSSSVALVRPFLKKTIGKYNFIEFTTVLIY